MGCRYEVIRHKLVAMRQKLRGCGTEGLLSIVDHLCVSHGLKLFQKVL